MGDQPARGPTGQLNLWDDRLKTELRQAAAVGVRLRPVDGTISTGSIAVDLALGIGGLPRGRIVELYGPPGVGKTTFALQIIAEAQRGGDTAAFIDVEHCFDAGYAQRLGVNLAGLILVRSADGEQALRIVEQLSASKAVDAIVLDSVAALDPAGDGSSPAGESPFAHSDLVARGLRRIARVIVSSPACLLLINQLRSYQGFGYSETTTGGWGLKLHAAVRADMRSLEAPGKRTRRVGLKIVKNQFAPAGQAQFDFVEGEGFSAARELLAWGLEHGVLVREGGMVRFEGEAAGMGELAANIELCVRVGAAIRLRVGLPARKPVRRVEQKAATQRQSG